METIFPTDTGFEGFFVVGFRKYPDGSGQTQRTGTVILKRTYDIDPVSGTLVPCAEPLPVFTQDVQFEESDNLTEDDVTALRYEHDLAPCKPEGDVIVLGFAGIEGTNLVRVNSDIWLQRDVSLNGDGRDKALFGWEPRVDSDREDLAGSFSEDPDDYPPEWPVTQPGRDPLPGDFQNVFYNGYLRSAAQAAAIPFPHLPADAQISIERGDTDVDLYGFTLANEVVTARYFYYSGTGLDRENRWQGRDVTVNLDTLVIEPEEDRCYAVWRGVWDFDEHSEDAYRRLVVDAWT